MIVRASLGVSFLLLALNAAPAADAWTGEGVVVPTEQITLRSRRTGIISDVVARVGMHVKKGDVLLKLDDAQAKLDVRTAEIALKKKELEMKIGEAKLEGARARIDAAKAQFERMKVLNLQGAIGRDELLKGETDFKIAMNDWTLAEGTLTLARFEIEAAKAHFEVEILKADGVYLRAPFEGIISDLDARSGEIVAKMDQPLGILIARPFVVEVVVPEKAIPHFKMGLEVNLTFDGDRVEKGGVIFMAPALDRQKTLRVRIAPADGISLQRPGMTVKVSIPNTK